MGAAFADHQSWLQSLYAARERAGAGADAACATGAPPRAHQLPSPLPHVPMMWAQDGGIDVPFSGLALDGEVALDDDDFDGPVYRSLGSLTSFADGGGGEALYGDDFDEPVYRSLSSAPLAFGGEGPARDEQLWLQTMPPLLCRQRAGPLA